MRPPYEQHAHTKHSETAFCLDFTPVLLSAHFAKLIRQDTWSQVVNQAEKRTKLIKSSQLRPRVCVCVCLWE